jgi:acyl carrier protein
VPKEPVDRATREIERAWRRKLASGPGFIAARNDLERDLADIWAEVLGLDEEQVWIRDHFSDDLAGDSIPLVALMDALECLNGTDLPVDFLLDAPTIEEQADRLGG